MMNKAVERKDFERVDQIKGICQTLEIPIPMKISIKEFEIIKQQPPVKFMMANNLGTLLKWRLGLALNAYGKEPREGGTREED